MGAKRVLFLDDRSKRVHAAFKKYTLPEYELTCVFTVRECIKMLSNEGPWDIVSLDHDLNFEEFVSSDRKDCGMEVVRWIIQLPKDIKFNLDLLEPEYIIHSSNKSAAHKMKSMLKKGGISSRVERFTYD